MTDFTNRALEVEILDTASLDMVTGGDVALQRKLLVIWQLSARQLLSAIDPSSSDDEWCYAVHTLRSAGLAIGGLRLAEVAEEVKNLGCGPDPYPARRQALASLSKEVSALTLEATRLLRKED